MNTEQIQEVIDILTAAKDRADEDNAPVILDVELTKFDLAVLRTICKSNISVPHAVHEVYPTTDKHSVYVVLDKILNSIRK